MSKKKKNNKESNKGCIFGFSIFIVLILLVLLITGWIVDVIGFIILGAIILGIWFSSEKIRSINISKYKNQLPIKRQPILQEGLLVGAVKKKRKPLLFYASVFLGVCGAIGFIGFVIMDIHRSANDLPYTSTSISDIIMGLSISCIVLSLLTALPYWLKRGLIHYGIEDGRLVQYRVYNPVAGLANVSDTIAAGFALQAIKAVRNGSVPSGMSIITTPIDLVLKYKETDRYIKIKFVEFSYESDGSISNIVYKHRATIYKDYQDMDKVAEILKSSMINTAFIQS